MRSLDCVARREHQDRDRPALAAQAPADREAVLPRQQHVEHDRVVVGDRGLIARALAVPDHVHGVRLLAQALRDHPRRVGLVLYQQDAHVGGSARLGQHATAFMKGR